MEQENIKRVKKDPINVFTALKEASIQIHLNKKKMAEEKKAIAEQKEKVRVFNRNVEF